MRKSKCTKEQLEPLVKESKSLKEELENLINTTSWVQIGKLYGVTDNAVKKWAKSYGITWIKQKYTKPLTNR